MSHSDVIIFKFTYLFGHPFYSSNLYHFTRTCLQMFLVVSPLLINRGFSFEERITTGTRCLHNEEHDDHNRNNLSALGGSRNSAHQ